jgi:hypothetical protein
MRYEDLTPARRRRLEAALLARSIIVGVLLLAAYCLLPLNKPEDFGVALLVGGLILVAGVGRLAGEGDSELQARWRPDGGKAPNLYILEWTPRDRTDVVAPDLQSVDNSVSAALTHAQVPAHLGKEIATKKIQPPIPSEQRPNGRDLFGPIRANSPANNGTNQVEAMVRVIRKRLPGRMRLQLTRATLRTRADALVTWVDEQNQQLRFKVGLRSHRSS